ncbi:MAG: FMN-binding protein [Solobacterium sp.]|nr:FMN-binding protein [Solobacterium sp.]
MSKDSTAYKAVLLAILCAVCGLLLSGINALTAPIIAKNQLATVMASLEQIYPGGEFTEAEFDDPSGLIQGVYKSPGNGTIYKIHNVGYNSNGFTFMVAFNEDGSVGGFLPIEHNETDGFGARCFQDDYTATINGLTSSDPVPLLSGATLTSTAIQQGIDAAKALFNADAGISYDPNAVAEPSAPEAPKISFSDDFANTEPEAEEVSNDGTTAVYSVKAGGFSFLNEKGNKNEAEITLDVPSGTVKSVKVTKFSDTPGIGDNATSDSALKAYEGLKAGDSVDGVSGATFTSKSIAAMVKSALDKLAGGGTSAAEKPAEEKPAEETAAVAKYPETEPEVEEVSNDGTTAVYRVKTGGFSFLNENGDKNEAEITIDVPSGTVKSITVDTFSDTAGIGDKATAEDYLKKFIGVSDPETVDSVSGATFTSNSVKSMIQSVLDKLKGLNAGTSAAEPEAAETTAPVETASVSKYAETKPEAETVSNDGSTAKFRTKSGGFSFLNENGDKNEAEVEVDVPTGKVKSVKVTKFSDTPGIGDKATDDSWLSKFVGVSDPDEVDNVSGATFTSKSIKGMIQSALDQVKSSDPAAAAPAASAPDQTAAVPEETKAPEASAAPETTDKGDSQQTVSRFKETEPELEEVSNDGKTAVYRIKSGGFSFLNEKGEKNEGEIEIDVPTRTVKSIKITKFSDTAGIGDKATADDFLSKFAGKKDADDVDGVSGATFTSNSVKAMIQSSIDKTEAPAAALPNTEAGK